MPSVVIVHRYPMVRFGLAAMLDRAAGVNLIAHGDTVDAIPRDPAGSPDTDVLVLGADYARDEGVRRLTDEFAGRVAVLTVSDSRHCDRSLLDPRVGVYGCVTADVGPDELAAAVRAVARRRRYVPAAVVRMLHAAGERRSFVLDEARLSPREAQALALIGHGYTHHQVARRMGIAKTTVETYVERIREKLGLGNKAELTFAALSLGLSARPAPSH
jgi:DNA-binding NarL/FixJ family response regulator